MPLGLCIVLFLSLQSQVVAGPDESSKNCLDPDDHVSFLLTEGSVTKADAPAAEAEQMAMQLTEVGGGRSGSRDPMDLRELAEDAEEEKEIAKDEALMRLHGTASMSGMLTWIPPLKPRVRDIRGCLLEGQPREFAGQLESPIVIINLDSRPDRWDFVINSSHVQRLGRELKRWPAVQLNNMDDVAALTGERKSHVLDKIASCSESLAKQRDSPVEEDQRKFLAVVGCYLSHLSAVEHLVSYSRDRRFANSVFLVLEDDHIVHNDIVHFLPHIVLALRDVHWDAVRLDCWGEGGFHPHHLTAGNARVRRTEAVKSNQSGFGGSHAILYSRKSLAKIAQYLRKEPLRSVDDMFWTDELRTYCVNWGLVRWGGDFGSNVSKSIGYGVTDVETPRGENSETLRTVLAPRPAPEEENLKVPKAQLEEHLKMCRAHRADRIRFLQKNVSDMAARAP